jgi:hypothetical protein
MARERVALYSLMGFPVHGSRGIIPPASSRVRELHFLKLAKFGKLLRECCKNLCFVGKFKVKNFSRSPQRIYRARVGEGLREAVNQINANPEMIQNAIVNMPVIIDSQFAIVWFAIILDIRNAGENLSIMQCASSISAIIKKIVNNAGRGLLSTYYLHHNAVSVFRQNSFVF